MAEGLFVSTDGGGNIPEIKRHTDWDRDWDLIIPADIFGGGGYTALLFYKRSVGEGVFFGTDTRGAISQITRYTDWDRDWDLIIPGSFGRGAYTALLFYKRSVGEGVFVSTDGSGNISEIKHHTDWDLIIPVTLGTGGTLSGGFTALLFYKRSVGEGVFVTTNGSGDISEIKHYTDWDRDWDLIIPGRFGRGDYPTLLFYKRSVGEGVFVSIDGSGNISEIKHHTDWDRDWDLIIPGNFGGSPGFTDLLFYK